MVNCRKLSRKVKCLRKVCAYPDVGVLVVLSKVQHVVQSKHPGRGLSEVHGWVDMIL
jgi:hypothetical protein